MCDEQQSKYRKGLYGSLKARINTSLAVLFEVAKIPTKSAVNDGRHEDMLDTNASIRNYSAVSGKYFKNGRGAPNGMHHASYVKTNIFIDMRLRTFLKMALIFT